MNKFKRWSHRMAMLMAVVMLVAMGLPAALSADANITRKEAGLQSIPVSSATTIYKGGLVVVDADGYLIEGADTAGYKFAGVAYEGVDNSSGSDGTLSARVYTEGTFQLPATSITQAMVGQLMFMADDATFDESATNYICIGTLVQYVSATSGWIDIGKRTLGPTVSASYAVSGATPSMVNSIFTLATAGVHKAVQGIVTYTPATTGYATPIGVSGKVSLAAGKTFTGGVGYMWGVQGNIDFGAAATINQASSIFAALRGVISAGAAPVFTEAEGICCAYLDNLCSTDMNSLSTGFSAYLFCNNSGGWLNAAIYLRNGNKVTNLFRFEDAGTMVTAGAAAHGGTIKKILCDYEGVAYYLLMSTVPA